MRDVTIKGLNDNVNFNLGGDVGIISDVIEKGYCEDFLIYRLKLNGAELIEFLKQHKCEEFIESVNIDNEYIITAYDW